MDEFKQIATRLRHLRENRGNTQQEIANVLGCSLGAYRHYERGTRRISLPDLQKIADYYGVSINYFLGRETDEDRRAAEYKRLRTEFERLGREVRDLEGDYMRDMIPIPLIGTVPGSYPDFRDEEEAEEFYPIRKDAIHVTEGYCLWVTGNSMIGRGIFDGDIVFVDKMLEPQDGDIVIARRGDEVVIRIYREDENAPYLEAANIGYKKLRLKEADIIGVVVESRRNHRRR